VSPAARLPTGERRRWIALAVLCLGQLMMVLDATIVNVALPAIQRELHFTQQNLTWVMNGYLITFGGFLLLAGRLGDLVGRKKVFLAGLVLFTVASMLCGVAGDQTMLIVARLLQGIGGAAPSTCRAPSPGAWASPPSSTGYPARRPARTACRTGVTPR